MDETAVIAPAEVLSRDGVLSIIARLMLCSVSHAAALNELFLEMQSFAGSYRKNAWGAQQAHTTHERLRLRAKLDAIYAWLYRVDEPQLRYAMRGCDMPSAMINESYKTGEIDPKGFWRVDKDKDPELRHTVLSLIAFHDLQEKGLDAFLAQNDGEGWLIPETLRLADYGLGHDERAQEHQPVASRLGPRFYDWQLNEDIERSWAECAAHAELICRIVPLPDAAEPNLEKVTENAERYVQGVLI